MHPPLVGPLILFSLATAAAQSTPPQAAPVTPAPAPAAETQTWTDPALHLTFVYPSELHPMDPKTLPGAAHNAAFADDPDAERDDLLTGRCSRPVLSLGETSSAAQGPWGSILIAEIGPDCLPPKALKSRKGMNNFLKPLVASGTQILGMAPVGSTAAYLVQGHQVYLAVADGQPVVKGDLQPADNHQTIAVLAVQVNDHVVSWKFESNDKNLFNRILASHIDFGAGTPQALFPLQMPGNDSP
jgi:hypothetical protein